MLSETQKQKITNLATEAAHLFIEEFNEQIDPSKTDWDATSWDDDKRKLNFEATDEAFEFYQAELVQITGMLAS